MEPYEALFERIKELMKSAGFLSIVNICRGLNISVIEFFQSELFTTENLSDD